MGGVLKTMLHREPYLRATVPLPLTLEGFIRMEGTCRARTQKRDRETERQRGMTRRRAREGGGDIERGGEKRALSHLTSHTALQPPPPLPHASFVEQGLMACLNCIHGVYLKERDNPKEEHEVIGKYSYTFGKSQLCSFVAAPCSAFQYRSTARASSTARSHTTHHTQTTHTHRPPRFAD